MALVKYNNNSISAITTAGQLASGSMVLIKEQTASSSASISFVHGSSGVVLDSTYPIYVFKYIDCHPATDNVEFQFNMTTDGTNFNVTKTSSYFNSYQAENNSAQAVGYNTTPDLAQSTGDQILAEDVGNDNDQCVVGTMFLFNPSSTTFVKHFLSNSSQSHQNDFTQNVFCYGYGNTTSAITGVRFLFSSGNIDAGTIKLYGIKDS